MHKICLIGSPGVGKGSFSRVICERLNLKHISLGDYIRNKIKSDTPMAKTLRSYNNSGKLIPNQVVNDIVQEECDPSRLHHYSGYVLDGFPRTLSQAEFALAKKMIDISINVELDRTISITKLLGRRVCLTCNGNFNVADVRYNGYDMPPILPNSDTCNITKTSRNDKKTCVPILIKRVDDTEVTIKTRLQIFETEFKPILEYFQSQNLLKTFQVRKGMKDVEELIQLIISSLNTSPSSCP